VSPEATTHEATREDDARAAVDFGETVDGGDQPGRRPGVRVSTRDLALLATWDLVAAVAVFAVAHPFGSDAKGRVTGVALGVIAPAIIRGVGAYERSSWLWERPLEVIRQLVVASTILAWIGVLATVVVSLHADFTRLAIGWAVLPLAWYTGRQGARLVRRALPERVLIVGSGDAARRIAELYRRAGSGSVVVGCVDDDVAPGTPGDLPVLGETAQLGEVIAQERVDRVIVAFRSRRDRETLDTLRGCTDFRGTVDIVPRFFEFVSPRVRTYTADGLVLMSVPGGHAGRGDALLKRAIDVVVSLVALVALSPLMVGIALAILLDSHRPIFYRERRIGMNGRPFSIVKFRTLVPRDGYPTNAPPPGHDTEPIALHVLRTKREAALRATRVGAFMRRTSLDELPQLFNVLAGDMSLVGPRPLSPREDAALEGYHTLRRRVRPGITGLWQVRGRNDIPWDSRVDLDYAQVRHWSLWSDVELLVETPHAVLTRRGAE
jgi:exopolysaccharide biosynthesis polyprenyl glycosylphosphotransferase